MNVKKFMINQEQGWDNYIAGLWEGDGHIVVKNEKTTNFTFAITFHKNNIQLAEKIQSIIGFGYLRIKIKENALVLMIGNKKGLEAIVKLINGKLRTPKIHKFNLLIDWLNLKNKENKIIKYDINQTNLFLNNWLSGFTEADACFDIRITESKQKSRIAFRYRLDQRMQDPLTKISYESCLLSITNIFDVKLKTVNKKQGSYYHISITNFKSLEKLILYFNKFPLYGIKLLDYNDWLKAYHTYQNRNKITPELIIELKKIKYQMNSRRTDFNLPLIKEL